MECLVIKEFNVMPFTNRLHYLVEEISIEEFIAALSHNENEENKIYNQRIKAKVSQLNH